MVWPLVRLGDTVERLTNGFVGPTRDIYRDKGVPYLLARQVKHNVLKFDGRTYVSDEFNIKNKKSMLKRGDVLLVQSGHIGHSAVVPAEHEGHNCHAMIVITPKSKLGGDFLSLYFSFLLLTGKISEIRSGSTVPHLTCKLVKELQIPLPPIPEQKRIVAILDQAFADIERVRANTEQNRNNARALFESYLQQVFSQRGEGWRSEKLSILCQIKPPKKEAKELLNDDDLVSFVPMKAMGIKKKDLNIEQNRKLKDVAGSYTYFAENDVLLAKITPCFENGKLGLARGLMNGVGFGSSEYIVFRCSQLLNPDFLYHYLSRQDFISEGKKFMSGAVGHKRVSKDFIENHEIFYPSSEEQLVIVDKIENLVTHASKIENIYQRKLSCLDELKKSILQKAFSGELTANTDQGAAA